MKSQWNGELLQGMQELPMETAATIVGGESIFFWIGYGLGATARAITNLVTS